MTDARALRRRVTALAIIPATAGIFGASVAWASSHDPLAKTAASTAAPNQTVPTAGAGDQAAATDQRLVDLTAQVAAAEARIAALQGTLTAQGAASPAATPTPTPTGAASSVAAPAHASSAPAPAAAAAPRPAPVVVPAPRPAPVAAAAPAAAPAPAPPVHVVTKASP